MSEMKTLGSNKIWFWKSHKTNAQISNEKNNLPNCRRRTNGFELNRKLRSENPFSGTESQMQQRHRSNAGFGRERNHIVIGKEQIAIAPNYKDSLMEYIGGKSL